MSIEYVQYWGFQFLCMAVFYSVAVYLVYASKQLTGRGWLLAFMVSGLITLPGGSFISLIMPVSLIRPFKHSTMSIYQWHSVFSTISVIGITCLGFFLLANWARSRVRLDLLNALFSFRGRIPRSIFWLTLCILMPLGLYFGYNPFLLETMPLTRVIHQAILAVWIPLCLWIVIAVYAKRWHDLARSGWMSLIMLIPVLGFVLVTLYLGFMKCTDGRNQYGDDPLIVQG